LCRAFGAGGGGRRPAPLRGAHLEIKTSIRRRLKTNLIILIK